jgi:hypothetical protein
MPLNNTSHSHSAHSPTNSAELAELVQNEMLIRSSDLPASWAKTESSDGYGSVITLLRRCLDPDATGSGGSGISLVRSPAFSLAKDGSFVQNFVDVAGSVHSMGRMIEAARQTSWLSCFNSTVAETVHETIGSVATVSKVSTSSLALPSFLDNSIATRAIVEVATPVFSPQVYLDFVFAQRSSVGVFFMFVGTDAPFDKVLEEQIIETVAGRIVSATSHRS